ncbi:hypothetical protein, partial [Endozoicomonas sp. YOMI1]|uniref:hypothetical protein n=1 Tax=Endozoicomonas sp. YOMI1 TaxID=2828739 RepID=UPI002148D820
RVTDHLVRKYDFIWLTTYYSGHAMIRFLAILVSCLCTVKLMTRAVTPAMTKMFPFWLFRK